MFGWAKIDGLRIGGLKLIHSVQTELFDLAEDPAEERDLAGEDSERVSKLLDDLQAFKNRATSPLDHRSDSRIDADDETRDQLVALGYLTPSQTHGAGDGSSSDGFEPDRSLPNDFVWVINEWSVARDEVAREQFIQAEGRLRYLLTFDPTNPDFRTLQALVFANTGREDEALVLYETLLAEGHVPFSLLLNLGELHKKAGEPQRALEMYEMSLGRMPRDQAKVLVRIATLRKEIGDLEGALEAYREVSEYRPGDAEPWFRRASIRRTMGEYGSGGGTPPPRGGDQSLPCAILAEPGDNLPRLRPRRRGSRDVASVRQAGPQLL